MKHQREREGGERNELVEIKVKFHWINYLLPFCWLLFYYFAFFTQQYFPIYIIFLKVRNLKYLVTKKIIVVRGSIISTHTKELRNLKVESISVKQSILGRLFGRSTLTFSGTGGNKLQFKNIANAFEIKSQIEDIIEKTKTATTR